MVQFQTHTQFNDFPITCISKFDADMLQSKSLYEREKVKYGLFLSILVGSVVSEEKMFVNVADDNKWMMNDECLAILYVHL